MIFKVNIPDIKITNLKKYRNIFSYKLKNYILLYVKECSKKKILDMGNVFTDYCITVA